MGRDGDGQAARRSRAAACDVLPHVPGDEEHSVPCRTGGTLQHAKADRRARVDRPVEDGRAALFFKECGPGGEEADRPDVDAAGVPGHDHASGGPPWAARRRRGCHTFPGGRGLFSNDFLKDSIVRFEEGRTCDEAAVDGIGQALRGMKFPIKQTPNESQTEDDLIWPVLARIGWTASLRQQNLEDIPDGLLFGDEAAKARANGFAEEWTRYALALAIVESKRRVLSLDGRSDRRASTAPSTQMLRYLRRLDDLTTGRCRWGILTNGRHWRIYHSGARSVSEQRTTSNASPPTYRALVFDRVFPDRRDQPAGSAVRNRLESRGVACRDILVCSACW